MVVGGVKVKNESNIVRTTNLNTKKDNIVGKNHMVEEKEGRRKERACSKRLIETREVNE